MPDFPEGKVVAPYIGTVEDGAGKTSFAGYFLRDLHQQGRLNEEVIRRVVEEHETESSFEEIMAAITDIAGMSVSERIARDLDTVASVGSAQN